MSKRIMICDESPSARQLAGKILIRKGYEVACEAADRNLALELYKELRPDAVMMNVSLRDADGIDVMEEILKIDNEAKVIMMSAVGHSSFTDMLMEWGAKAVIVKPLSEKKLMEALNKI